MKQNKQKLKTYFETGDKPTEKQYGDLIDSYVDSKQPKGDPNRRFVIDANGEVIVTSERRIPEYTFSEITNNTFSLLKDGVAIKEIDLTNYIDDTNLSRLISGSVGANGMATFTRDDDSTFEVDFNNFLDTIEGKIPEYTFSEITGNKLALLKDGVVVKEIDLSIYLDDTNLARLVSGSVDANGIATFTRDDDTTFTINFSDLISPQVQADWSETDNSKLSYIENKPTNLSDFSNDTNFITQNNVPSILSNSNTITIGQNIDNDYILTDGNNLQTVADRGSVILDRNIFLNVSDTNGIDARYTNVGFFWSGKGTSNNFNGMIGATGFNLNGKLLTKKDENSITIYFPENDYGTDFTKNEIALKGDIPKIQAGTNITIDNTNPREPIINSLGGGSNPTDLSYKLDTDKGTIVSSNGTDVIIPVADKTNAGLMKADFYEEGNFTPVLASNGDASCYTSNSVFGQYTRLGNKVTVHILISNNSTKKSPNGDLEILNMPFDSVFGVSFNLGQFTGTSIAKNDIPFIRPTIVINKIVFKKIDDSVNLNSVNINGIKSTILITGTYKTNIHTP